MPPDLDADLPPLEGLDALDQDRAADMLYNRPLYATPVSSAAGVAGTATPSAGPEAPGVGVASTARPPSAYTGGASLEAPTDPTRGG